MTKRLIVLFCCIATFAFAGVATASTGPPKEDVTLANVVDQSPALTAKAPATATLTVSVLANDAEALISKDGVVAPAASEVKNIEPAITAMIVAPATAGTTFTTASSISTIIGSVATTGVSAAPGVLLLTDIVAGSQSPEKKNTADLIAA